MIEQKFAWINKSGPLCRSQILWNYLLHSGEIWKWLCVVTFIVLGLCLYHPEKDPLCCPPQTVQAKTETAQTSVSPPLLPASPSPFRLFFSSLFLILGGWLLLQRLLRGYMWAQMYRRGFADLIDRDHSDPPPLPGQEAFITRMGERLAGFSLLQSGPLWAIKGTWGSGKSFLMAELQRRLEKKSVAVVNVHIWREQSANDLHLAIVDAILSHPKVLRTCFACYPNRIALRHLGQFLMRMLPHGLRWANGSLETLLEPDRVLPMSAQRELEQVVACARMRNLRIVLILDEVDRATIPVAQAAIVLTRRALNLPGLAVILPYVGEQLRLKVFNPLYGYSPDLHQTLLSHIESHYLESRHPPLVGEDTDSESLVLKLAFAPQEKEGGKEDDKGGPGKSNDFRTHTALRRALREEALLRYFWRLTKDQQRLLIEQSEEKYLSLRDNIPELQPKDIPKVLQFPSVAASLQPEWTQANLEEKGALGTGVARCGALLTLDLSLPPVIRHFEGCVAEYFGQAQEFSDLVDDPALLVLWITTLAWRRAQLIRGIKGGKDGN